MILINLILIPIFASLLGFFVLRRFKQANGVFSLLVTAICLVCSYLVFLAKPIKIVIGYNSLFLVDNLAGFISLFISLFGFLITIYSLGFIKENKSSLYYPSLLLTLGASYGAVFASDLLLLLIFWGILGATLYLLINEAGPQAKDASKKTFIIVGGADVLLLLGMCIMWKMQGTSQMESISIPINNILSTVAYLFIAVAAFAKAGVMPFHSWVPDAAEKGPVPVTAFLPASLDKLVGIYLLARMSMNLFVLNGAMSIVLLAVGSFTIIAGAMMALVQHDAKRLLGYHAVSQVGYMVLGIGTMNPIGIAGGLFHMVNNAIYKSCFFLTEGNVENKTGTSDLEKLGGLAKFMPVTFICFIIAAFSISGVPPFNGFVSKWMIYQGAIEMGRQGGKLWIIWLGAAMFGSALTLASFMKLTHSIFLGVKSEYLRDKNIKEAQFMMVLPAVVLAVLCVLFGVFAYQIPIKLFINPAVYNSLAIQGIWAPTTATILMIVGIVVGLLIYLMGTVKTARTDATFIGGEKLAPEERVTGTEFYETVKDVGLINGIYKKAQEKKYDIYDIGNNFLGFLSGLSKKIHSGLLPMYIIWCLMGMIILYLVAAFKG